jgi:hypothetical protein
MRLSALATLVAAAAVAAVPVAAQSLGEVAAQEKARREKQGKRPSAKVITEDELRGRTSSGTVSQPAADGASSTDQAAAGATPAAGAGGAAGAPGANAPGGAPQKTEDELRAERQTEWRQKLQEAQGNVSTLRARQDQIQTELNDTRTVYGPNRASLVGHLEKTKAALAQAEQMVANLEEEGRRQRYR